MGRAQTGRHPPQMGCLLLVTLGNGRSKALFPSLSRTCMGLEAFTFLQISTQQTSVVTTRPSSPMLMMWLFQSRVAFYFPIKTSKQKTFRVFLITQGLERGLVSLGLDEHPLPGGRGSRERANAQHRAPHWSLFLSQQPSAFRAASSATSWVRPPHPQGVGRARPGTIGPAPPLCCEPNLKAPRGKENPVWD